MYDALYHCRWRRVVLSLKNIRNVYAREHPLAIFEAVFKSAARGNADPAATFVFHALGPPPGIRIQKGRIYDMALIFPRAAPPAIEDFLERLARHLENPKNNFTLISAGKPELRCLEQVLVEQAGIPAEGADEICLDFQTPFPFTPKIPNRKWLLDRGQFMDILHRRVEDLFGLSFPEAGAVWEDIGLLPYYWEYIQFMHQPKSNPGAGEHIGGCRGPLFLKGPVSGVYPLLAILSELHASRKSAKGRGFFRMQTHRAYFDLMITDKSRFATAWERMEAESDLAERLAETFLDREAAVANIHDQIINSDYRPDACTGFQLEKAGGGGRGIAIFAPADQLVQKILYDLLNPVCDKMLENASIGFRRGRSRDTARHLLNTAYAEGYRYVLESDISAFFDEIDWEMLGKRLDHCLPATDRLTRHLLDLFIRAELVINGRPFARTRGLIQGSPLSPLLSNLYLDAFDEAVEARGYRLIRYADDFLVLTRTWSEAIQAIDAIEMILSPLKLKIKKEKTAIHAIDAGFSFLGLQMDPNGDDILEQAAIRKPLFISQQYGFIGMDGDAVIISKENRVQNRFPIKRISEIIVFGGNSLSTRLIQKCAEERVPVSFCSAGGYYINTLRPDSKAYFDVTARHANRFASMTPEDVSKIAGRIADARIGNYLAWISSRFPTESDELRRFLAARREAAVRTAASADEIRGQEGLAAARIFRFVNDRVIDPAFHSEHRIPRKKADRYNSLLDFAYFLLFARLNVLVRGRGLNPYLGFLHSHKDDYESLVTDLQEPFRCRMDRMVIRTINLRMIKPEEFLQDNNGQFYLDGKATGRFIEAFEREFAGRRQDGGASLKQLVTAQVQSLYNWVMRGEEIRIYSVLDPVKSP